MTAVEQILDTIIGHEGGFVDDKYDKGGATKYGVSLRYAKGIPELDLDHDGDIDRDDIMLVDQKLARKLYKRDFYYAFGLDELPTLLQPQLFDLSVNAGGRRAVKTLQYALVSLGYQLKIDGYNGRKTTSAAHDATKHIGLKSVNEEVVRERINFYHRIVAKNPSQKRFLNGWTKRAKSFLV
jgi:lysozyme family protein